MNELQGLPVSAAERRLQNQQIIGGIGLLWGVATTQ